MLIDALVRLLSDMFIETAEKADLSIKYVHNFGPPPPRRGGFRRSVKHNFKRPIWHDKTCEGLHNDIKKTTALLRKDPNNPWLRGQLQKEQKLYKKLQKQEQGKFVANLFDQLDECQKNDPHKYMALVKQIRDESFEKLQNQILIQFQQKNGGTIFGIYWVQQLRKQISMPSIKCILKKILMGPMRFVIKC